uniref:Uncharacterized protein n=1 Tax=Plectus sambesii TaxID=2011161 RepID=A0A914WWT3_9BILA
MFRCTRFTVDYLKVSLEDAECSQLDEYFDLAADLIEHHRMNGGKTLVHCAAGRSRSASLCIIYLVKYGKQSLRDSFLTIRRARPVIAPNPGFWRQMIKFEKGLNNGKATVEMLPRFQSEVADVCLTPRELEYIKRWLQKTNDSAKKRAARI